MNRPMHDWFILQEMDDEQEDEHEQALEHWWMQQDQDQEFISHTFGE